jgi:hypothetical protein
MGNSERLTPQQNTLQKVITLGFGQGPVLSKEPIKKIIMHETPSTNGALNWWGEELVSSGILLAEDKSRQIKVMGGNTGPEGTLSEAELIDSGITSAFLSEKRPVIDLEKGSTNTLENLVNICNEQLDTDGKGDQAVDIWGASFHLTRMKILMKLFDIPYRNVIGAKNLMEYAAIEAGDEAMVLDIQQRHDTNAATRQPLNKTEENMDHQAKERGIDLGYYAQRDDSELKTIVRKQEEEDLWTRALLTIPDYSLPYLARIQNDERLMGIMRNFDTNFFPATETEPSALEARGITVETDSPDEIREKLSSIKRDLPDEEKREAWIAEQKTGIGWPIEVEEKLQNILYPPKSPKAAIYQ